MNMAASRSRNTIVDFVTEPRSMTLFSPTTTPQQHDVRVLPRVAKVIENTPRAPWVDAAEAKHEFGLRLCEPSEGECDAIVVGVGHDEFRKMDAEGIRAYIKPGAVMYEVKYVHPSNAVDGRL
jgi:UDP-N-acetyl-D-mannosaminuronate dehydrogenase